MAELGFRTVNEMVGRTDKLQAKKGGNHWKAKGLKLDNLLHHMHIRSNDTNHQTIEQDHGLENALDNKLLEIAKPALDNGEKVRETIKIRNVNRTVGTMLSAEVTRRYGKDGLPDETIHFKANGSCGQSFGAFGVKGVTFEVEGDANDYFGKGLSGGKLILYPPKNSTFKANENVIIGNVTLYGATSGEAYIYGLGGERFCVRNSGARVVIGAIGDHGCEYMTGGRVVILGTIGKNFGAGMSGGIAYILDEKNNLKSLINKEMVELERLNDNEEIDEVRGMIEKYVEYTGSVEGAEILANWEKEVPKFIKVMPTDYKRALAQLALEKG